MHFILYLIAYLPILFLLYFLVSIVKVLRMNKKHANSISLYGNGLFKRENLFFHTVVIMYFIVIVIIGVMHLTDTYIDLPTNYFIFSGPVISVFLILWTTIIFIHLGENGVLIGKDFYSWNEIRSVEVSDSDNLRPEVLLLKILLKSDHTIISGYLNKKNLDEFNSIIKKQHFP